MLKDRAIHERVLVAVCREIGAGIGSVNVRVEQGIVQVSGVVDTPAEYAAVEHAIWDVPEVRGIAQRLRVRRTFQGGPTDTTLAEDVLRVLEREGHGEYRVHVQEGVVTVVGQFRQPGDREMISAAVASVRGVRGVWTADDDCFVRGTLTGRPGWG
ncbi:MAG TPA: BON domain-containing protein [Gemmatimonadaceae bacterium]|nr:BON domain-containing protein [Gemmatimonadaceae bacterium]